jgi:hypothetical protein
LKSAITQVAPGVLLANPAWANLERVSASTLIQVAPEEPAAANALLLGESVIYPEEFPLTAERIRAHADLRLVPTRELQKAEAGVTCRAVSWVCS